MIEVSLVIPCINEEKTIEACIRKAREAFGRSKLAGEVIVVDNGSTDGTVALSKKAGAVVVIEPAKGYGSALRAGIAAANGRNIVMGDGDDTYDFNEIDKFAAKLKEGFDLVMGSRFKGKILPGAMTWSHRYIGNPILSGMLRFFFGGTISDSHCGFRAFTKEAYNKMDLHTTGMEFASEMVIHAMKKNLKITELPITYHPRVGESKLDSFKDAWRHIRFMLLYSPGYLFIVPGFIIFGISLALTLKLSFGEIHAFGRGWGVHPMVFFSIFTLLGWQIINTGVAAKVFANAISLEEDKWIKKIVGLINLERSLVIGFILMLIGAGLIGYIFYIWALNHFGALTQIKTAILALTVTAMGLQTIVSSFLVSMLQIKFK